MLTFPGGCLGKTVQDAIGLHRTSARRAIKHVEQDLFEANSILATAFCKQKAER